MELFANMINVLKDVPDEPSFTESGSDTPVILIVAVVAVAAVLLFLLFRKKPKA